MKDSIYISDEVGDYDNTHRDLVVLTSLVETLSCSFLFVICVSLKLNNDSPVVDSQEHNGGDTKHNNGLPGVET
jgi:hypothetical protein